MPDLKLELEDDAAFIQEYLSLPNYYCMLMRRVMRLGANVAIGDTAITWFIHYWYTHG